MSDRATQLFHRANEQIAGLSELLSHRPSDALAQPCPGREKLGDGTVASTAQHITRVYRLLAQFVDEPREAPAAATHPQQTHDVAGEGAAGRQDLLHQLTAANAALGNLAELSDAQLDSVPPAGSLRFCDGKRTLEEVIARVLGHQSHHIEAVRAALG